MDAQSTICLSDLVPALRWSRPQQVAELLADPRLPGGWWGSVTISRALGITGVDWVCDRLARLALRRWDHIPLIDLLPALQVHAPDPALPGWSDPARSAINGVGGWFRLRRLTPADLQVPQGAVAPEILITAAFREIFSRLPIAQDTPAPSPATPDAAIAAASTSSVAVGSPALGSPPSGSIPLGSLPPGTLPAGPVPTGSVPSGLMPTGPMPTSPLPVRSAGLPGPRTAPPRESLPPGETATPPETVPRIPQQGSEPPLTAPVPSMTADYPMVGLVDALLRGWDPLEKAIAAERLFAVDPISLRALAYRLNVDREVLSHAQRAAEQRVLMWMRSPDSAALTGHLFGLTEWLGSAATQEQLISVDPSHPIEVPSLGTPLWRVLVALMPDRRLQDGWLVVGDLGGLQEKTRRMLAQKPADDDVVELLGQIGIRSHSAKDWLKSLPAEGSRSHTHAAHEANGVNGSGGDGSGTTTNGMAALPRRTPGVNGHARGGVPIPPAANNVDPQTALAALSALAGGPGPRPHLVSGSQQPPSPPMSSPASDPRRWQRIDVTSEHLRGAPVAVPEGYATQLGMRPGTLLSVTGPGDNAVVLVWRDRQPVFDSLQPVLMRLNARPGDSVYVTVNGYRLDAQLTS